MEARTKTVPSTKRALGNIPKTTAEKSAVKRMLMGFA